MRAEGGRVSPLTCVQLAVGKLRRAQLGPLVAKHDDTIIDAGGRDNESLRIALLRSDLVVVPVQPRTVDVWSLGDIVDLVDRGQEAREDEGRLRLCVLAVLNLADPRRQPRHRRDDRSTSRLAVRCCGGCGPPRKAVANAMAHGLGVAELQPRDPKAVEEIEQPVSNVFSVTEIAYGNHTIIEAE